MEKKKDALYRAAFEYEKLNGGCAQCTMAAINDYVIPISDEVFTSASALAAGIASTGKMCCACVGGILVLGSMLGRDYENFSTELGAMKKFDTNELAKELVGRFEEEYGSCSCRDIQERLLGKGFDMTIAAEREEFLAMGGHGDKGCPTVTGNAAVWFYELLEKNNLV
ncbi:MAG: C-GCAxxG-C-C family protein [Eubacteriales bacterium]